MVWLLRRVCPVIVRVTMWAVVVIGLLTVGFVLFGKWRGVVMVIQ